MLDKSRTETKPSLGDPKARNNNPIQIVKKPKGVSSGRPHAQNATSSGQPLDWEGDETNASQPWDPQILGFLLHSQTVLG
jgi:hypothetical protein